MTITLKDVGSGFKRTALKENFDAIESELNNNVLRRDGVDGANQLEVDIDVNSQRLLNLVDAINGREPVTLDQLNGALSAASSGLIAAQQEQQTGAQVVGGVTTFTGITYTVSSNNLYVFRNGNYQTKGVDYNETSTSSITWTTVPNATDALVFITNLATTNSTTDTAAITHTESGTAYNLATYLQNRDVASVKDYGADPSYSASVNTSAIQACIDDNLGGSIFIPRGVYATNDELVIPYNGGSATHIFGENRSSTVISMTGVTNKAVIRLSASYCTIEHLRVSSDSLTNSGIRIAPEDETQTTSLVGQNYNIIQYCNILGTMGFGVALICGPEVGGSSSGCYHNHVHHNYIQSNVNVGVHLNDGPNAGSSTANRNWVEHNYFTGNMNVGVWNQGADTTTIDHNSFEGVDFGTSPITLPTAVVVENVGPTSSRSNLGVSVSFNRFETYSAPARHIDNRNVRTYIVGGNHERGDCVFAAEGGADPLYVLGGYDYSSSTMKLPGYKYQTNSQEAIPNSAPVMDNGLYLTSTATRLDQYNEGSFTPTLMDNSNDGTGEGQTYSKQVGRYTRIGNRCFFDIRLRTTSIGTLTPTEVAKIGGLPFPAKTLTDYTSSCTSGFAQLLNLTSSDAVSGIINSNTSEIALRKWSATTGTGNLLISEWSADGDLAITGNYEVA